MANLIRTLVQGTFVTFLALSLCPQPLLYADAPPAVLYDVAGKGDRSFNDSAAAGVQQAKQKWGLVVKEIEPKDPRAPLRFLESLAQSGSPLLFGVGFTYADPIKRIAPKYPKTTFVVVDGESQGPNVVSVLFREHEGAYLAGYLAAKKSKNQKVGFIGGMDIPLIRRFQLGFEQGARSVNPKIQILSQFIGQTPDSWTHPSKAKEIAKSQIAKGTDVIFHAAGGSGMGVIDAAFENKVYAIGCDSNQNQLRPGTVIASLLKKIDGVLMDLLGELRDQGHVAHGTRRLGLNSPHLALELASSDKSFESELNQIRSQIKNGKIKVKDAP